MSCITYTCECLAINGNFYPDKDFNEDCYAGNSEIENCIFWPSIETDHNISDDFFGVVDGFMVLFDKNNYYCSCTACLNKIYSRLSKVPLENSNSHEDCIDIICTYIQERVSREIRGEHIFQVWDICRYCLIRFFQHVKSKLIAHFHLSVRDDY